MGQEIGNELDEQNGKDKLLPHFYVRLGLIFFLSSHNCSSCPQSKQLTRKVYVQATTADSAHSSPDFIVPHSVPCGLCTMYNTWGVSPSLTFEQRDWWLLVQSTKLILYSIFCIFPFYDSFYVVQGFTWAFSFCVCPDELNGKVLSQRLEGKHCIVCSRWLALGGLMAVDVEQIRCSTEAGEAVSFQRSPCPSGGIALRVNPRCSSLNCAHDTSWPWESRSSSAPDFPFLPAGNSSVRALPASPSHRGCTPVLCPWLVPPRRGGQCPFPCW